MFRVVRICIYMYCQCIWFQIRATGVGPCRGAWPLPCASNEGIRQIRNRRKVFEGWHVRRLAIRAGFLDRVDEGHILGAGFG